MLLSSYQPNETGWDCYIRVKVKGKTEMKITKQAERYLRALLPHLEGSLHSSDCSGLPRLVNRVNVTSKSKSEDGSGTGI